MQVAASLLSSTSSESPDEPLRATETPPGQAISSSSVAAPVQVAAAETVPPPAAAYETDVEGASMRPRSGLVHVPGAAAVPVPLGTDDAAVGDAWWCSEVRDGTDDAAVGDAWWCSEVRDGTDDAAVGEVLRDACLDVAVRAAVRDASDDAAVCEEVRVVASLADRGGAAPSVATVPEAGPLGAVVVERAEGEMTADARPPTEAPASGALPWAPATAPGRPTPAPPVPFDVAAPRVPLPPTAPERPPAGRRPTEPPMVPRAAGARPGTCDSVGFAGDRGRDAGAA